MFHLQTMENFSGYYFSFSPPELGVCKCLCRKEKLIGEN
jgi:hypothetical protein